ncbi:unnamed protein product [Adineta steineri]|uniref:G-protein coupled receptors family 1 profile domain-containing protein n=2 Tax=Adineta steineri TaxID=433720 RepID=A0A813TZV7_9BILA|nr:unnamed protein product [Adineta steineri]
MNSSMNDYSIGILNKITIYSNRYVFPIAYVVGNIGNILSLIIFSRKSWKKNVCVFYFKFLLVLSLIYINPALLGSFFITGLNINLQNTYVILCKLLYYVSFVIAMLSPTVLILASIDRLLISSQNVDTRLYSSKRLAYFSISISTIFWCIFFIHILIKVNIQEYYPSVFICYYDLSTSYLKFINYSISTCNVVFCVLMIILSIFTFKNIHHIRTNPNQQRQQIRTMNKKDFQLLRCLFVQDIAYISCSFCSTIYNVYAAVIMDQKQTLLVQAIDSFSSNLFSSVYKINNALMIFIFIGVSKAFRQEVKRLFYRIFGKKLTPLREEDIKQQNSVELNVVASNIVV